MTDEDLVERVREHLKGMRGIKEKPMIGGISFMWRGNLLCGVMGTNLPCRAVRRHAAGEVTIWPFGSAGLD